MSDERLVVSLEARIRDFERNFQRAQATASRSFTGIEQRAQQSARRVEQSMAASASRIGSSFTAASRTIAGALGVGFGVQSAQKLIDTATRIRNSLKVAGLEGDALTKVYDRLYASAQKNAAPLETMADLYSRVAQAQDSLGVSSDQIINFTDKIGVALRVAGTSASQASGALLQLGQALGAGTVRAEEFNSINEGARPILQAVAAGLREAGGSVAELRKLVLDGKVSSEAFFRAFEAGAPMLEEKVANAEMTVSQRFIRLQNVLVDTAGKLDDTTGASDRVGEGLDRLAGIVEGIGEVFEAAANGPIGTFIGKLEQLNSLLQKVEPLSRGLGFLTGDTLGGLADWIEQPDKVEQIESLKKAIAKARAEGADDIVRGLEQQLDALVTPPSSFRQGPTTRSGRRGNGASRGTVQLDPISIDSYPVDPSTTAASPAGRGGRAAGVRASTEAGENMAASFIKKFEGYSGKAYWDVNAYRVGYGSDTVTGADGRSSRVTASTLTTVEAAERDLVRRIGEFQRTIQRQIGADVWGSMAEEQQAALTSIAYNCGELPDRIVKAIEGGNPEAITQAIRNLSTDNGGINAGRRDQEADLFSGGVYARADSAAIAHGQTVNNLRSSYESLGQIGVTAARGLANALADGKLEAHELLSILADIVQQLLTMPQVPLGGGANPVAGGGLGIFGSIIGALFGFADGGHVSGPGGPKDDRIPAMLSNGEFVVNAAATRKHRAVLEAINSGAVARLADGGHVGSAGPVLTSARPVTAAPEITITNEITVNGSAGTPEQNEDLAKRMSKELEKTMRGVVADEILKQSRPGNTLNSRARMP